jgi:hypothetical protein
MTEIYRVKVDFKAVENSAYYSLKSNDLMGHNQKKSLFLDN